MQGWLPKIQWTAGPKPKPPSGIVTTSGIITTAHKLQTSQQPHQSVSKPEPKPEPQKLVSDELQSNTTANGDGLILRRNQPNIFDMIAAIKNTQEKDSDSSDQETSTLA